MPELPEVETIVRGLNKYAKGRRILGVWTDWPKYFKFHKNEAAFRRHVVHKKILAFERRAKNILIHLSDNHLMLIHQKMSGHLMIGKWQKIPQKNSLDEKWAAQKWSPVPPKGPAMDPMNRFIRLIFFLENGEMLALSDLRRFAKVLCVPRDMILNLPELKNLGPEPLAPAFTFSKFLELSKHKRGRIKQLLMDPTFVSGIGNIYADEILWVS